MLDGALFVLMLQGARFSWRLRQRRRRRWTSNLFRVFVGGAASLLRLLACAALSLELRESPCSLLGQLGNVVAWSQHNPVKSKTTLPELAEEGVLQHATEDIAQLRRAS